MNTSNETYVIQARNLHKRFSSAHALAGIDLDIEKGIIVGLLGPNGSGKSSLLKCIAGLYHPTEGELKVLGKTPSRLTKSQVAFLPELDHLYAWMSVGEILKFVSTFYPDWRQEEAEDLLATMNLKKEIKIGKLSKGMRARLKLVLTMARKAPLILLDEPLSGIDPPSRSRIVKAIVGRHNPGEQTIVLSTHDVADTESMFDKVILLDRGTVKLKADADKLRQERQCSIQDVLEEEYV